MTNFQTVLTNPLFLSRAKRLSFSLLPKEVDSLEPPSATVFFWSFAWCVVESGGFPGPGTVSFIMTRWRERSENTTALTLRRKYDRDRRRRRNGKKRRATHGALHGAVDDQAIHARSLSSAVAA